MVNVVACKPGTDCEVERGSSVTLGDKKQRLDPSVLRP